ncbi:DUF58 domain-containing protein [Akkermansiaceae bacterium]|nr:DUF58 domain-containing protein [Akkermansiaceae bacterium]MDB4276696.1 DUF58 domain-containing protein [bacterium]MDB4309743.1 DUF58 domain-containing protein [Akkermansiaceae bacterium]MDB4312394.1 DUF58 domain-containing protein [bacterium]MDB4779223.1 DUF58 domain-containing protein [bacterium]
MPLRPTKWLVRLLILWTLLGLVVVFRAPAFPAWKLMAAILSGVALFDALIVLTAKKPHAERTLPGRFAVGVEGDVTVRLFNKSGRAIHLSMFDGVPEASDCKLLPWTGWVKKGGYLDVTYPVALNERGETTFGKVHVLESSLLHLWSRNSLIGEEGATKVYPNYQPVLSYALLAMAHRQEQSGIVRKNRAGLSRDFHQLRDYQQGDSLAQIDWKASSKRQALISRDFQEQRDQSVILMLDCGRRMRTLDGEISQFDHCLNSMLLLSYIALRQGDHVGVLSFGGTDRWLAPVKGAHSMTTVLNHLYDYETAPFPSDFSEAAERLLSHQRRRALVVILTNLRGEDSSELSEPLRRLRQKHPVVLASLREEGIGDLLDKKVQNFDDALGYLGAEDYAKEREMTLSRLRGEGIVTLDARAKNFPVALANCYLDTREII